jgi:hypothetical protein
MIHPDADTLRMLVRERHARLSQDAAAPEHRESLARVTNARRQRRQAYLMRFRFRFNLGAVRRT